MRQLSIHVLHAYYHWDVSHILFQVLTSTFISDSHLKGTQTEAQRRGMCQGYISNKCIYDSKRTHAFQLLLLIRSSNFFTQTLKQRHHLELINTPHSSIFCLYACSSIIPIAHSQPLLSPHEEKKSPVSGSQRSPSQQETGCTPAPRFHILCRAQNHNDESKESCLLALGHRIMLRLNQMLAGPGR